MSVNVNRSYTFFGFDAPEQISRQIETELDNIGATINNANAGLLTWDNVKATTVALVNPLPVASGGTNSGTALSNNRVIVSSSGKIVESSITTTTLGFLDATSSIQTQLNGKQATLTVGQLGGTATNDNASAGNVGEAVRSYISTATNFPTSTQWGDLTSISLTAGDWDVSIVIDAINNGSTQTVFQGGISTTTGNSATGLNFGDNAAGALVPTAATDSFISIPSYRMSLSSTTTVYLKYSATYSLGTPQAKGRISARRMR